MTPGDSLSPRVQLDTASTRRKTHRMLDADRIRERFKERPEVADWIFAVREELVTELGDVDTLSKFAYLIKAKRPKCDKSVQQLRRRASEQLTTGRGPSSKLAEYVLAFVVTDDRRPEVRRRFAALYAAARGEQAPFAPPTPLDPLPAPVETIPAPVHPPVEVIPAGSATTGELRGLVTELKQMIRDAEQREVVAAQRAAVMRAELAARTSEVDRLRMNFSAVNVLASATRNGGRGNIGSSMTPDSISDPLIPLQRDDRYESLAALDELSAADRWAIAADLDLETYWLGETWNDLHHASSVGSELDPREIASKFGFIARTLSEEGVGAGVRESEIEHEPATANAEDDFHRTKPIDVAGERVPREWTSQGPLWFNALIGVFMMMGLPAAAVALVAALNAPPAPIPTDNFVISLINQRRP